MIAIGGNVVESITFEYHRMSYAVSIRQYYLTHYPRFKISATMKTIVIHNISYEVFENMLPTNVAGLLRMEVRFTQKIERLLNHWRLFYFSHTLSIWRVLWNSRFDDHQNLNKNNAHFEINSFGKHWCSFHRFFLFPANPEEMPIQQRTLLNNPCTFLLIK